MLTKSHTAAYSRVAQKLREAQHSYAWAQVFAYLICGFSKGINHQVECDWFEVQKVIIPLCLRRLARAEQAAADGGHVEQCDQPFVMDEGGWTSVVSQMAELLALLTQLCGGMLDLSNEMLGDKCVQVIM